MDEGHGPRCAHAGYAGSMAVPARNVVTEAEYLAFEDAQERKHELVNGEIVAMSGCSEAHATVAMNLLELRAVTVNTRGTAGRWTLQDIRSGAVAIDVLGVTLDVDDIYAGAEGTQGWG